MSKTFVKSPVKAAADVERKYHAFQISVDVAVPLDGEMDSYDFETLLLELLETESKQTEEFVVLGSGVEDMDHTYDDESIAHIGNLE